MYQSISQRFRRKNSNDLIVTFLPVIVVLTLHSYLRNADLNPTLFRVLQITAIVLLAALLAAVNHFYFRSFCYTLIDGSESRPREALRFPDDSLTFERVQNRKSRIYERVRRQEMLCLLEPGEAYDEKRFGPVSRTFLMTARSAKAPTACITSRTAPSTAQNSIPTRSRPLCSAAGPEKTQSTAKKEEVIHMAEKALVHRMEQAALTTKIRLLDLAHQTLIHIGGDLSVCDMMTAIWQYAMHYDVKNPHWEGRDRFVLSKGHAAAVTSFSQAAIGCYDVGDIYKEYATNFGRFGMHSCNLANPYVDVSTGSLGHGFPVACGMATALKRKGSSSRVYTVVGDGECGEGSIWEAAMYAHQYKLGNLVVFVDRNGMSFDGPTEEYMALEPFADKWRAFGWNTVTIDGHDMNAILDAIDALPAPDSDVPTVIIGKTVKGHGVSFMENNVSWHAGCVNEADWIKAKAEITEAYERKWGAEA